jgi:hypothetical protein
MLTVFQTSGPDLSAGAAPQPVHTQLMPEDDRVRVSRAVDDSVGHICFAAIVRDLTGRVSSSGNEEVCTDTVQPPFFYGCAMHRSRLRSPPCGRTDQSRLRSPPCGRTDRRPSHEGGAVAALAVAFIFSRRFLGGRRPSRGLPERAPNA